MINNINSNVKINMDKLRFFSFALYVIAITGFQLGTGFDAIFIRVSFFFMVIICLYTKNGKLEITSHVIWCIVFWLFYYLSVLWAHNIGDVLQYINTSIQIMGICICLPIIIKNKNDIETALKILVLSIFATAVRLYILTPSSAWGTERIGSAVGLHSNTIGLRMALAAVMVLYLLDCERKKYLKNKKMIMIYFALLLVFILFCFFSGSKRGLFTLVLSIVSYIILSTKGLKFFFGIVVSVLILYGFYWIIMHNQAFYSVLGRRIEKFVNTIEGSAKDASTIEREYFIQTAKKIFLDYPILGYGGNNFRTYLREIGYHKSVYSHSNFFELLSTLGIVGFVIYYSLWIKVEYRLINQYLKTRSPQVALFLVLMTLLLIGDYGGLSYIIDFTQVIVAISFILTEYNYMYNKKIV